MNKLKGFALILGCAVSLMFTACGKTENKEKVSEDFNNLQNGYNNEGEKTSIPESVSLKLNSLPDKTIVANVDATGYQNARIYSAEEIVFDDDYIKSFADKLFSGSYEVKKPIEICSYDELSQEWDYLMQLNADAHEDNMFCSPEYRTIIDEALVDFNDENVSTLDDGTIIKQVYDKENGCYFDKARLKGTMDDMEYILNYASLVKNDDGTRSEIYGEVPVLSISRLSPGYRFISVYSPDFTALDTIYGENVCSEEDARAQAEQLLRVLGLSEYIENAYSERYCIDYNDEKELYDGYRFLFVKSIDGIPCCFSDNYEIGASDGQVSSAEEYILIDVDHLGIVSADFYIRYNTLDVLSEKPSTISFDKVIEIAENSNLIFMYSENDTLNMTIQFTYAPLKQDGRYVYMPVWKLLEPVEVYMGAHYTENTISSYPNRAMLGINMIDGTTFQYPFTSYSFQFGYLSLVW